MRISTSQYYNSSLAGLNRQNAELNTIQKQIATGSKVQTAADNPADAARIVELNRNIERNEQYQQNQDVAFNRLSQSETVLSAVDAAIQRATNLIANSPTAASNTRVQITQQLKDELAIVVDLANTRDTNGDYLYAGHQVDQKPYSTDVLGNVVSNGDEGQRQIQIADHRRVSDGDSGFAVFQTIQSTPNAANAGTGALNRGQVIDASALTGNDYTLTYTAGTNTVDVVDNVTAATVYSGTYTPGGAITFDGLSISLNGTPSDGDNFTLSEASMFSTLEDVIATLDNPAATAADIRTAVDQAAAELALESENLTEVRNSIASRMSMINTEQEINTTMSELMKDHRSELNDVDMTEAVLRLQQFQTSLQAAQQAFAQTQQLSLFNYL